MKYIFLFLVLIAQVSFACETFTTRYVLNKRMVIQKEEICLELNTASSRDCATMFNPKCPFSQMEKKLNFSKFVSPIGSPGFNLCHHLGGSPQLYEIEIKSKKWKPYERCFSMNKVHFVDIDTLIKNYK